MTDKPPEGKTKKWKQGQFTFTHFRQRGSAQVVPEVLSAEPQSIIPPGVTVKQQLTGSSLGDMAQNAPPARRNNRHAGTRCQAPKGSGVCGTVISCRNPHTIPVCQPCSERLRSEALSRGQDPDLDKIWKRIQARHRVEEMKKLADRPSGMQPIAQPNQVPAKAVNG